MIFNFSFNENEVNLVMQSLGELPAKVSLSLLNKLQAEAQKQMVEQKGMLETPDLKKVEPIKKEDSGK